VTSAPGSLAERLAATRRRAEREGPVLEVSGVSKMFGAVVALSDVSLSLRSGEVLGLVGDNGAGKSTLVNIVSGTIRPSSGAIVVDDELRVFHSPADARRAGIETVFQDLSLIPTLNIAENVHLGRETFGSFPLRRWLRLMDGRRMRRDVGDGLASLQLRLPSLRTKVAALSGGQRQAVAVARAILWGSHIVLLDEPTASLGVEQTEHVLSFIEGLRAHGVAVIFITHNMDQVLRVADRIIVLRLGKKVADLKRETVGVTELVGLITGAHDSAPPQGTSTRA
jgi:ABC-type sugar transport system ATPase subunit